MEDFMDHGYGTVSLLTGPDSRFVLDRPVPDPFDQHSIYLSTRGAISYFLTPFNLFRDRTVEFTLDADVCLPRTAIRNRNQSEN